MKNCSNIGGKIFPSHICPKWGSYWEKTCWGCRRNFKFGTQADFFYAEKKTSKLLFSPGPATLRKWDLKYTNILYFFSSSKNICCGILRLVFNWSLHDCVLGRQGRELKLISCMQSNHPQIYIESETEPKYSPKYFVWNNYSIWKWVLWWRFGLNL